jgi:hypothetical protein
MAVVVIGGHSRSVGKTSLVAELISALPGMQWTAAKITQFGHGFCSTSGEPCQCATDCHDWAITEERDRSGQSDSSRFLIAGAAQSLWVRTRMGKLGLAMPDLLQRIASARNVILESNSVLRFLQPDLYLTVLNPGTADFKTSSRQMLARADAIVLHSNGNGAGWKDVALPKNGDRPIFRITPPPYCTPEIVEFVRARIAN